MKAAQVNWTNLQFILNLAQLTNHGSEHELTNDSHEYYQKKVSKIK